MAPDADTLTPRAQKPELADHLEALEKLENRVQVPTPPSVAMALNANGRPLPPSVQRAVLDLTDEQGDLDTRRLILERNTPQSSPVFETPEDRTDRRAATDALMANWYKRPHNCPDPSSHPELEAERRAHVHHKNVVRKWKDRAKKIEANAPPVPDRGCIWWVSQKDQATGNKRRNLSSLCDKLTCSHCSQVWRSRRIADAVDAFGELETVNVLALDDKADSERFAQRHKKRRQRSDTQAPHDFAMSVPVTDGRSFVIAGHDDKQGVVVPLSEALEMLDRSLADRIALAKLTGKDADNRRVSWPGKSTASENVPHNSVTEEEKELKGDKAEDWITIGGTDEPMTADNAEVVLIAEGIPVKVRRKKKGEWALTGEPEALEAADVALAKAFNLRTENDLANVRTDRADRLEWENDLAEVFA